MSTTRAEALKDIDTIIQALSRLSEFVSQMDAPAIPRVLFASPVTGKIESISNVWGGDWFDATGYGKLYNSAGEQAYHTGADLNRPNYADAGAPVYAAADGELVFAGPVSGWQGKVIVIKHALEDGSNIWTRYAHVEINITSLTRDEPMYIGRQIGAIADYTPKGPSGDHLHYDIARIDLGARPGDWPGMDTERLHRDYINPFAWHVGRLA